MNLPTGFFDSFKLYIPNPVTFNLLKRQPGETLAAAVPFTICRQRPLNQDELSAIGNTIIGEEYCAMQIWNTVPGTIPEVDDVVTDNNGINWRIRIRKTTIAGCLYSLITQRQAF